MKKITLTNMKKLLFIIAILLISSAAYAAQVDMIIGSEGSKASLTTNFSRIQNNFTELFARQQTDNNFTTPLKNKLDALPEGTNILTRTNTDTYTPSLDYHPATKKYVDEAPFAPALGADDNYVTDAEKTVIGNTSGANTGDQTAATVSVTDTGSYYTGTDTEAVLQEIGPLTDAVEITAGTGITILSGVISVTSDTYQAADADLTTAAGATGAGNSKYFGTDSGGTAGFFALPTGAAFAFDTFPTYEDSPHTSGIARNGTTGAMYSETAGKWLTFALTDSLDPAPTETYALVERFDGSTLCFSGYSSNCDNAWSGVVVGTPTFNYATTPAPLEGTYSLGLPPASEVKITHSEAADVYYSFKIQPSDMVESDEILARAYNNSTLLCFVRMRAAGTFRVTASGGTEATTAATGYNGLVPIYLRLHYVAGTGADAVCSVAYSTDGTTWSATTSSSNGTVTASANTFHFEGEADAETMVYDILKIKTDGAIENAL